MELVDAPSLGRRERNKLDKLERITSAARELFSERGVDDVTTQQIADRADIGTGTLFLYAKTKAELLLLVQNSAYADALVRGTSAAEKVKDPLDAVIAILRPVVECNRAQVENGRMYLREIVFGDPDEPHHRQALNYTFETEAAIAAILQRGGQLTSTDSTLLARVISSVMLTALAVTINKSISVTEMIALIRDQVGVILR
jgi:TetR/AcrR family transcriptional regulator